MPGRPSQGHTVGHLSVGGSGESPFGISSGTVETAVNGEESTVRKMEVGYIVSAARVLARPWVLLGAH